MIPFLLILQIPRILTTAGLFISIIITISECVSFHRQIWTANNDERKLITLLPKLLRISERLQQAGIADNNDQVMITLDPSLHLYLKASLSALFLINQTALIH